MRGAPSGSLCRSAQKLQFSGVRHVELQPGCCVFLLVHWIFSLVYCRGVRRGPWSLLGVSACACGLNIKIKNKTPTILDCRDLKGCDYKICRRVSHSSFDTMQKCIATYNI